MFLWRMVRNMLLCWPMPIPMPVGAMRLRMTRPPKVKVSSNLAYVLAACS